MLVTSYNGIKDNNLSSHQDAPLHLFWFNLLKRKLKEYPKGTKFSKNKKKYMDLLTLPSQVVKG